MRIIAGKYKGKKITHDRLGKVRPTQDRVREAVFSMIQNIIVGSTFLDLFCGTGSNGIEALSRGALSAVFVDMDIKLVKSNTVGCEESMVILRSHVNNYLRKCQGQFDIIYMDPPWTCPTYYQDSLKLIWEFAILKPNGLIVCEHPKKLEIMSLEYECNKMSTYGNTQISVYE